MEKVYAMVLEKFGGPFTRMEFDKPAPKNGEVLIKIAACGVCGSDVHVWKGEDKRSHLPMILGHEGIGFIESLGGAAKQDIMGHTLHEGDFVVWNRGVSCKSCYTCLVKRQFYACPSRWSYGFSKSINDYPYLNGGYASHILLTPETEVIRILPKEEVQPTEDYSAFASACCAGTTTACAFEQTKLQQGDNVVIQGPGPLGVYAVLFAKESGARNIVVVGGTRERLELCEKAGATLVIDRHSTTAEQRVEMVRQACDGRGGDAVFELTGSADAVPEGLQFTAPCGTYTTAGIAVDVGDVPVNWFRDVVRKNITVQGVWVGDSKNTWQAVEVYRKNKALLNTMVTHRIPLQNAHEALQMMERKAVIKAVLVP